MAKWGTAFAFALWMTWCPASLSAVDPAPRSDLYGDPLPEGTLARLGTLRWRHCLRYGSGGAKVAFSPDGKLIASQGDIGLRLWDPTTGTQVPWFYPRTGVKAFAFSADGKTLITEGIGPAKPGRNRDPFEMNREICHWEVGTGKLLRRLEITRKCRMGDFPCFSVNGEVFVSNDHDYQAKERKDKVRVWDSTTGQTLFELDGDYASVTVSPDRKTLAIILREGELALHDVATGKRISQLPRVGPFGHHAPAFSPDGKMLISSDTSSLHLWDVASGDKKREIANCRGRIAFSPDGRWLACACPDAIRLWDWPGMKDERRFEDHHDVIYALAFSPDGKQILSGQENIIALWDVATGKQLNDLAAHHGPILRLAFSPDGKALASGGDTNGTAVIWDPDNGRARAQLPGHYLGVRALAFTPDGKLLATGEGINGSDGREAQIRIWNAAEGRLLRQFFGHLSSVHDLAFAPDSKTLASAGWDARVRLWDPATGKRLQQLRGLYTAKTLAFSKGGELLVADHFDGYLTMWQPEIGKKLREFGPNGVRFLHVALLADGTALEIQQGDRRDRTADTEITYWNTGTGQKLRSVRLFPWNDFSPNCLAVSADGKILAVADGDRTIPNVRLWDLELGKPLVRLRGQADMASALSFSSDGRKLAVGSWDTTILLWDVPAARRLGLWSLLATDRAASAQAGRALAADPDGAVPFLKERLRVAQTLEAPYGQTILDLDSNVFATREQATRKLAAAGAATEFALELALQAAPLELQRRVEALLKTLTDARQQEVERLVSDLAGPQADQARQRLEAMGARAVPALRRTHESVDNRGAFKLSHEVRLMTQTVLLQLVEPDNLNLPATPLGALGALAVLEGIGNAPARAALAEIAKGPPESRLAREARAALVRLDDAAKKK